MNKKRKLRLLILWGIILVIAVLVIVLCIKNTGKNTNDSDETAKQNGSIFASESQTDLEPESLDTWLEHQNLVTENSERMELDVTRITSQIYINQEAIYKALREYANEHSIDCYSATGLDFRYVDREDALVEYDLYFLLDDEALVTIRYAPPVEGTEPQINVSPCEYTYDQIISQKWLAEEIQ